MDRKPLLLIKLGSNDLGGHFPWVPEADDMRRLQEHLEDTMGDEYHILVYHTGIDIQAVDAEVKEATVESLKELLSIVEGEGSVTGTHFHLSGIGTEDNAVVEGSRADALDEAKVLSDRWKVSVEIKRDDVLVDTVHPNEEDTV